MPEEEIEFKRTSGGVLGKFSGDEESDLLGCDVRIPQEQWVLDDDVVRVSACEVEGSCLLMDGGCDGGCDSRSLSNDTLRPAESSPNIVAMPRMLRPECPTLGGFFCREECAQQKPSNHSMAPSM